ncbi:DUF808 domain-containing protein [Herbaspirillum sp. RTI4]|uniref:DUF808 domain-containing protein n=1 Tax=Herbaspirillum sp. RTI4 TaxID=3048640 RepID=UPI002AB4661D|nr:DUF808 domain-containing protein [Herbaspirillum sp. RTI4]MDY7577549.1 DUF808 domain-containing protein [Herbaspirillum sp. RTI4]MEA9981024.1 DUF808 domain-containing protein [Herbaspirillum sp. RTI4]
MAVSSLFALIDDIASILDDVSLMTKVAAQKTAGVLGDDLALNAQQVSGVGADRELPVVWAVAKGSLRNKIILVPAALIISALTPWAVTPLLMAGGLYLCYEGSEKLLHAFKHRREKNHPPPVANIPPAPKGPPATEQQKIAGAIRTDFVLSAEIIAITLGIVAGAPLMQQITVLSGIALVMTIGVYGAVAGIVKLDDAGLYLVLREGKDTLGRWQRSCGRAILSAAPVMMKSLSVIGTVAMFTVGGGILMHGIPAAHALTAHAEQAVAPLAGIGGVLAWMSSPVLNAVAGLLAGAIALAIIVMAQAGVRRWKRN